MESGKLQEGMDLLQEAIKHQRSDINSTPCCNVNPQEDFDSSRWRCIPLMPIHHGYKGSSVFRLLKRTKKKKNRSRM